MKGSEPGEPLDDDSLGKPTTDVIISLGGEHDPDWDRHDDLTEEVDPHVTVERNCSA